VPNPQTSDQVTGFLSIEDLADSQGELTICVEYNSANDSMFIEACTPLPQNSKCANVAAAYLSLCDSEASLFNSFFLSDTSNLNHVKSESHVKVQEYTILNARTPLAIFVGKKYKPVTLKIRSVKMELPSRFRITCNVKGNPLEDMSVLPT